MWLLKLKIKHDCTIGNRCQQFQITSHSIPLGNWEEKNYYYTSERHSLEGDQKAIRKFLTDLKKDKQIQNLEISGNTIFFIGKYKEKIPSSFYNQKMFFTQPVFVNKEGYEFWEIASYQRKVLSSFTKDLNKENYDHIEILRFCNTKINNIYFPATAPNLTQKQKRAFELAVEHGYYALPKTIDLHDLAKLMNISLPTYQEHLRKAESKIMPRLNNL